MRRPTSIALAVVLAALPAAAANSALDLPEKVTWAEHVAPLVHERCAGCHRPGDIAPMSLLTYDEARPWAKGMLEAVKNGEMPPWHADPQHGEFANDRRLAAMDKIVKNAAEKGARVATGGKRVGTAGNFFAPTILTDVPLEADIFNEEPFGPIAAIRSFETLDEAIREANRLPYGLAAYAFTRSFKSVHELSRRLEVGMVWINQPATPSAELPFGGVKQTGNGHREGGWEVYDFYSETKVCYVDYSGTLQRAQIDAYE